MTSGVPTGTGIGKSLCSIPEEMARKRVSLEPTFVCVSVQKEILCVRK